LRASAGDAGISSDEGAPSLPLFWAKVGETKADTTPSNSWSFRKCRSDPSPVTASTLRTPDDTLPSFRILINPISPVAPVCVPPQSSVEKSPIRTTRTLSPYFSPNKAIA